MHWGTFQLTDEPLREPHDRLLSWWRRELADPDAGLADLAVGETIVLEESSP
jgi:hypothetical protein